MTDDGTHVAFVCVQNAGRSQMATAYAEREREARDLTDAVVIHSGGTHPADAVHDIVREAMAEEGIDLSEREPQHISDETLESCDYVATMGCSTLELEAETDVRDWDLPDPHGQELETVHEIREDVRGRVEALFDEIDDS
ncbi:arsenate-mycothiol transferase ArsC [Natronorubrum sp. DTA28]|uniref:arsenate-mycothiol transferase ArsC n=1 Tax=Natronorubrum sp. DTA28 TaxID=3447019 RepID=UPI003F82FF23